MFLDVVLLLLFLGLTLSAPLPAPHEPMASIIPGRIHPNYHDAADGLSGIQVAGIVVCSLVGLFILGFVGLVTWDSYQDRARRKDGDMLDDFGFPVSTFGHESRTSYSTPPILLTTPLRR